MMDSNKEQRKKGQGHMRVTTQAELDEALARDDLYEIVIDSPKNVWFTVRETGQSTVHAYGWSTVRAYGQSTVHAYGWSTVRAYGQSTVHAYGRSTVRACDRSTVYAYGQSMVHTYDQSTVRETGQSTVYACDQSAVRACDQSTVYAYGQSTVHAYDQSTVRADGQSTVRAGSHVAVYLHSTYATVNGGMVIDVNGFDLDNAAAWCAYGAVEVVDGKAILFKATDMEFTAGQEYGRPTVYMPGTTVTAEDWDAIPHCGRGLHLSQSPSHAEEYCPDRHIRFLKVEVDVASIVVLDDDKVKVPSCKVLAEVDMFGREIEEQGR